MRFLHDPDSRLSPEQALAAEGFRPLQKADLLQSFNAGAFWLQLSLYNPTAEPLAFWLELGTPRIHWVELHHQGQVLLTGAKVPMAEKPVTSAHAVLPLELAPGSNRLLLRVQSETAISLDSHLWRPEAFRAHEGQASLKTVLVLGGVMLASLLSLIAFALLREWPYLFLGLTQLFAMPLEMARTGLMQAYLWPDAWPFFSQVITLSGTLVLICLSLFVSSFLSLRQRHPRWNRLLLALLLPILAAGMLSLWHYPNGVRLLSLMTLIQLPLNLVLSLVAWRGGHRSARFLTLAFALLWGLETLRQLANNGLLVLPGAAHFSMLTSLLLASPILLLGLVEHTRSLAAQLQSSRALSQAKADFLARVSHELRAPLNSIIGYARMLKRGSARLPVAVGAEDIEHNGQRLLGMINQLLLKSGLDAGGLGLQLHAKDFALWWRSLVRAAELDCQAAGNAFVSELKGEAPIGLMMDGYRLRQVLENLLNNANKHCRQGEIRLSCRCSRLGEENFILAFEVADTGRGIAQAELERILQPFVQLNPERGGMGLGLSITQELLQLMGSQLQVSSQPGEGSQFSFSLELEPAEIAAAPSLPVSAPAPIPAPISTLATAAHAPLRLLLVEDEPQDRLLLEDALESLGFELVCASSGREAETPIQRAGRGELWLDGVISDQCMADGDGWQVLRSVRRWLPELPVILVSSLPPQRPLDLPMELDFDAYLAKPISAEQLGDALSPLLGLGPSGQPELEQESSESALPAAWLKRIEQLAAGGEVSLLERELDAQAASHPRQVGQLRDLLYRLDLAQMQRLALVWSAGSSA
ncbi:MAG: response regulator [Gammaproteobacteria bacterium]|nr:response regulator [Gammaproteobacteria bacterium]